MKSKKILILIFTILLFATSCKVYFTPSLRHQVEGQGIELEDIQFYNSRSIVLWRLLTDSVIIIDTSNLKQLRNLEYRKIKIRRNTPCICKKSSENLIEVIFSQDDSSTFKFALTDTSIVKPRYKIGAFEWDEENVGSIVYNDTVFFLKKRRWFFQPNYKESSLKVKRRIKYKYSRKTTKLKGVKIGG